MWHVVAAALPTTCLPLLTLLFLIWLYQLSMPSHSYCLPHAHGRMGEFSLMPVPFPFYLDYPLIPPVCGCPAWMPAARFLAYL